LRNADSVNEVRLRIKLESKRGVKEVETDSLELIEEQDAGGYFGAGG